LSIFDLYEQGKKPFNPVIGEVFKCSVQELDSKTNLISEQLSHHPPTMALFLWNTEKGFSCTLNNTSKTQFWGSHVTASFDHLTDIFLQPFNEHYITNQIPSAVFGTFRWSMEFKGNLVLKCPSSGYAAEIQFHPKSMFSSKLNKITGIITKDESGNVFQKCKVKGQWHQMIDVIDNMGNIIFSWNREKLFPVKINFDNSHMNSSALIWKGVIDAILRGDWSKGDREKFKVEEDQRRRIREMQTAGKTNQPCYFMWSHNAWRFKS